jgi:hypothetical protein
VVPPNLWWISTRLRSVTSPKKQSYWSLRWLGNCTPMVLGLKWAKYGHWLYIYIYIYMCVCVCVYVCVCRGRLVGTVFFKGYTDVFLYEETVLPSVGVCTERRESHVGILHSNREKPCGLTRKRRITISDSRICPRSHHYSCVVWVPLCTLPTRGSGSFATMTPS